MRRIAPFLLAVLVLVVVAACSGSSSTASPSAASPEPATPSSASPAAPASGSGESVEVVATEYAFGNVPATAVPGTAFTLKNAGSEAHELVLVRKNEGVTLSFDELLALPQDDALNQLAFLGQLVANPGDTAQGTVVADAPGDYLMVCFIPQGLTQLPEGSLGPDASLPAGPPHFTLGMRQEFTVE